MKESTINPKAAEYVNLKGVNAYGEPVFRKHIKDRSILVKRTRMERVLFTFVFILFMCEALSLIYPMLWLFVNSFKGQMEYIRVSTLAFPAVWQFGNYADAFTSLDLTPGGFWGMIFNSVWYTLLRSSLVVFMPSIPAYVLCKYKFPGSRAIYTFVTVMMMVPLVGTGAAYLKTIGAIGAFDNVFYVIVASMSAFTGMFVVYYGYFQSISWSYAEAVMMDGGGPFTIWLRIMLPQAMPIMLTFFLTEFIAAWNDYATVLLYLPSYPTLASGLFQYQQLMQIRNFNMPVYFAGLIISMIPILILFSFFSGRIMGTVSVGGLKG